MLTFVSTAADFSLCIEKYWDGVLEYSLDGVTWKEWNGSPIKSENGRIYLRGRGNTRISGSQGFIVRPLSFSSDFRYEVEGNIMSLLEEHPEDVVPAAGAFQHIFADSFYLAKAPNLTSEYLSPYCFAFAFVNCPNLALLPQLSYNFAENTYLGTFIGCTNIEYPSDLPESLIDDMGLPIKVQETGFQR